MADRTLLTVSNTISTQSLVVVALAADVTWTAADVSNGNRFLCTGKELLLVKNTHAADPGTVTIAGVADAYGRTGSITTYSLAAAKTSIFGRFATEAFMDTLGYVNVNGSAATIYFAVIRIS